MSGFLQNLDGERTEQDPDQDSFSYRCVMDKFNNKQTHVYEKSYFFACKVLATVYDVNTTWLQGEELRSAWLWIQKH